MLSSSLSTTGSHDQEEDDSTDHNHSYQNNPALPPGRQFPSTPVTHMRQLLISCAELVSQADFSAAHRLVSLLSTTSSPYGDSTDRLVHQFSRALSLRINRHYRNNFVTTSSSAAAASGNAMIPFAAHHHPDATIIISPASGGGAAAGGPSELEALQSSYLSLNQITPFIRFSHLTANQAILEAIEGQQSIHILDFDTMLGVQWPPLMQAIAERSDPSNPPMIRITGAGQDLDTLCRTGERLQKFAESLGLRFQFHPLLLLLNDPSNLALHLPSAVALLPDETLAVNCVLYLHRILRDDDVGSSNKQYSSSTSSSSSRDEDLRLFLRTIKAMNPKVVTVAEREANNNHPNFLQRFVEALDHYTALFDSLEGTLPPNSRERLSVEQVWFGREIVDIVSAEGEERRERHEKLESWAEKLTSSGFRNVPLSPFALSQAKLLLRLHYPSEGYQLQILNDTFFLGWQNQSLFTVSSWF
ncbi:Transcription factor GRAS [Macleaya cordata]|uniref:Transcription factor GRAS n=1 Tax=Macleaya cordata TaxID=56857 RepID=A0A200QRP7_MACCD|nr:Transcription factor GRAS [Macleaya cordata]